MNILKPIARLLSNVFHPAFYPLVGFIILFTLSYLSMLPWMFRLTVCLAVYVLTVALPFVVMWFIRKANGWTRADIYHRHRNVAYLTRISCYVVCLYVCDILGLPPFLSNIFSVCMMAQCVCALVETWYKVGIHSTGTGLIIGALLAYSFLFSFNPVWWLIAAILLSGAVMSSRMYLYGKTLGQVLLGTAIGILCGFVGIILG